MESNEIKTTYTVGGNEITLTQNAVVNYLTRGNGNVTQQDVVLFISLCKFNKLNPFLNECYLLKYKDQPAQMVTSKDAYFKRAEENPNYKGIRSGVIVMRQLTPESPQEIVESEGCFLAPGDILLGGWAEVYRSDRDYPIVAKVNLSEYDKQKSIWNTMKSTMIAKIAKVQALREAFPSQLGTMYTEEETASYTEVVPNPDKETSVAQAENALAKAKKAMAKAVGGKEEKPIDVEAIVVEPDADAEATAADANVVADAVADAVADVEADVETNEKTNEKTSKRK